MSKHKMSVPMRKDAPVSLTKPKHRAEMPPVMPQHVRPIVLPANRDPRNFARCIGPWCGSSRASTATCPHHNPARYQGTHVDGDL